MSRPLRIEFEGAWYHVMNRGAGRRIIFKSDLQREYFLSLLDVVSERFQAECHAYCLMDNHYHLMLRTPRGNLQRIMRHINGVYTQFYNRDVKSDGPLFRGRYKAILVDAQSYWSHLSRYIHRNPLEAGLVRDLKEYKWSSYPCYIGELPPPGWLNTSYILSSFGKRSAMLAYMKFVTGESENDSVYKFFSKNKVRSVMGAEGFTARRTQKKKSKIDVPELKKIQKKPSKPQIFAAVAKRCSVTQKEIMTRKHGLAVKSPARSFAMLALYEEGGYTLTRVAEVFGLRSYASVGTVIRVIRDRIDKNQELADIYKLIKLDLTY